jgi:carboxylesterase
MPNDQFALFRNLNLFADPLHLPFAWKATGSRAAVLIHGFPGTPADMRPLGEALHGDGWTAVAPLLPGFGPAIPTLPERKHAEWASAVTNAIADLRADNYGQIVLVGHSLGAALALPAGVDYAPDAQILLAPYWRFGSPLRDLLWPLLQHWMKRWRPLSHANFDDPRIQEGILHMLPDLDLDDHRVRDGLRSLVVPTTLLDELRKAGAVARNAAQRSQVPTLVIQGLRDSIVQPRDTDALMKAMPHARLEFSDSTHSLTRPDDGAFERVRALAVDFLNDVRA